MRHKVVTDKLINGCRPPKLVGGSVKKFVAKVLELRSCKSFGKNVSIIVIGADLG